jgi:hypothetical protein
MQNALLMESIKIIGSHLNKFDNKLVREVKERLPGKFQRPLVICSLEIENIISEYYCAYGEVMNYVTYKTHGSYKKTPD